MSNVITALGNPILNNELLKIEEINVLLNDLQYKEAIIEFLEKNIKIDYLILSESLPGEINVYKLINILKIKYKNIKIILIKERKNERVEDKQEIKNVDYIFYNNEVEVTDIIRIINNKKTSDNEKIKQDIEMLKKIVLNKNVVKNIKIDEFSNIKNENKIITILGGSGVGKSIFTIMLSKVLKNQGKKILMIDFDILNNNIHTILGIKKYSNNIVNKKKNDEYEIEELIISVNQSVDLLSGLDLIFSENQKIDSEGIIYKIENLKNKYDYIIIDTSSECFFEYNRNLILRSNISVFLVEANLLEIKKARRLLDIYEKEWKINREEIKIIINKYNNNSIKDKVLIKLFDGQEIVGKIQMSDYYNKIINKNNKVNIEKNTVKNEYIKISEKILKVNFNSNKNRFKRLHNKIISNIVLYKKN